MQSSTEPSLTLCVSLSPSFLSQLDEPVDLSDVSLHVTGAILKDLLRNVPGGVIPSARYTEFVATNDIHEYELRIQKIRMYVVDNVHLYNV